ncbi:MAG: glutathione S-transferase family protein [Proteobacteria bacterium]|nr:glutathione S-transferase family protein [Pseudomonadota bacterium]
MQLHDNAFSPYALKVRMVLYEKGVDFELCEVWTDADRERLRTLNPRVEVPALVDDGVAIADSRVICEYLEERFPEPAVYPRDARERARCRRLELKSDGEIDACAYVLGLVKLFRPALDKERPEIAERAGEIASQHHARLEQELGDREWLCGELSLADLALAPHLRTLAFMGHPPGPEHPALAAWLERLSARPSVRRGIREMAANFARASSEPGFEAAPLHWRDHRIECAVRCGLGSWLDQELASGGAFLSPIA